MTQILEQRELNTRELVLEGGMSAEEEAGLNGRWVESGGEG